MIKLKNLWKVAFATMAMSAMLVACGTATKDKDGEEEDIEFDGIDVYFAGLNGENSSWANATDSGSTPKMTKGENDIWTYTFTAEKGKPFPYGFKLTTENGWMEQYQAYNRHSPSTDFTFIETGKWYEVFAETNILLDEKDEKDDTKKIPDNASKWNIEQLKACTVGEEYTITFDKKNMKIKLEGNLVDVQKKNITVIISIIDKVGELTLKNVPTYDIDNIAEINGSLFGWTDGKALTLLSTDSNVSSNWTGSATEKNSWVAKEAPADTLPPGTDKWAKLGFSADNSAGWVPYNSTGKFTYDWNNRIKK